jgi:hypothetical protein
MVTISSNFTWRVSVGQMEVPICDSASLQNVPSLLTSSKRVIDLLVLLESCKLCVGNPDEKFSKLVTQRDGKFTDRTGNIS